MRIPTALVLFVLVSIHALGDVTFPDGHGAGDVVFSDGFETGDDRYWTGPLEACAMPDGDPAPLCPGSMDRMPWMLACEAGERCWHICTDEPCLYLDVEAPNGAP